MRTRTITHAMVTVVAIAAFSSCGSAQNGRPAGEASREEPIKPVGVTVKLTNSIDIPWELDGARERIRKYRMGDVDVELILPGGVTVPKGTQVEVQQTGHNFHFGASLTQAWTINKHPKFDLFLERFEGLFSYATVGFYWDWHEREPGTWQLRMHQDKVLSWAKQRGMIVKGHPLMWHSCLPGFVVNEKDVQKIDGYVLDHVRMLVSRYPQVDQWDLYNETPGIRYQKPDNGARRWVEAMGGCGAATRRLVAAVRKAHPKGFYMLNHFTHNDPEYDKQIAYCVDNKVAFDAIGIQAHMHTNRRILTERQAWETFEKYAAYGKPIHLSEVTVLSSRPFRDWRELQKMEDDILAARKAKRSLPFRKSTPEGEKAQARYVRDFYTLAFSHPAVDAIAWWSVSDCDAWRGSAGGLIDEEMNPKPAYKILHQLINHDWRTKRSLETNRAGRISFRGFYGDYDVQVTHGGRDLRGTFRLARNAAGPVRVILKRQTGIPRT